MALIFVTILLRPFLYSLAPDLYLSFLPLLVPLDIYGVLSWMHKAQKGKVIKIMCPQI